MDAISCFAVKQHLTRIPIFLTQLILEPNEVAHAVDMTGHNLS